MQSKENEQSSASESGKDLMERLIGETQARFQSQDTFIGPGGKVEGYGHMHAAEDVITQFIAQSGIDSSQLFFSLIRVTTMKPVDVLEFAHEADSWDEFLTDACGNIISEEFITRFPEAEEETTRRMDTWSSMFTRYPEPGSAFADDSEV